VLSHVDKNKDPVYHKDLMQTGVYVEYDSHFRWKTTEENRTYTLLEKLLPEYSNRIVIGMDMARSTYWKSYGGKPGLAYLLTTFKEELKARDLDLYFEKLFFTNPRNLYSFKTPFS
jgi:phosphotriesterase-related protein